MPRHVLRPAGRAPMLTALGVCGLVVAVASTLVGSSLAAGDIKSADEMIRALSGEATDRSEEPAPRVRGIQPRAKASAPEQEPTIDITVHFATDSAEIERRSRAQIREIALAVRQLDLTGSRLSIIGHTDSRGPARYNQDLSRRRARAVRQALVIDYGLSAEHLVAEGKGESELLIRPELTPEDYARNRRVELRLLPSPEPSD